MGLRTALILKEPHDPKTSNLLRIIQSLDRKSYAFWLRDGREETDRKKSG
jgi:hypothetical protein